jgi:hypothetical protein
VGVRALWLPEVLAWTGYPVFTIPGWETAGRDFRLLEVVVGHHTATSDKAPGDYPSTAIIRDGRPDLDPRLANLGLGRSGAWYVFSAGVANHAGVSAYAGFVDLNDEAIGIEGESAGTGLWTPAQRDSYPRGVAAILRKLNRPATRYASHRTVALPKGRKPDPVGIDDAWLQGIAAGYLARPETLNRNAAAASAAPTTKEPDVTVLRLAPGDAVTIPRPRTGKVFVDWAFDDAGLAWGTPLPDDQKAAAQQLRVAVHTKGGSWRPAVTPGNPRDPYQFWMPGQQSGGVELAAADDLIVIRNLHPGWPLGVTVTHLV